MLAEKLPHRNEFDELDELPEEVFKPGELGKIMVPGLADLINHYMKDDPKKEMVLGFVKWCPPEHLEGFLVKCMEYGADKTKPGNEKVTRRKTVRVPAPPQAGATPG